MPVPLQPFMIYCFAAGVIVAQLLLPMALEDMAREKERLASAQLQGPLVGADVSASLMREVQGVLEVLRCGLGSSGGRLQMREMLEVLQNAGFKVIRQAPSKGEGARVRSSLDSLMSASIAMQAELDAVDAIERINTIWFSPRRLAVGITLLMGLWSLLPGIYALMLLVVASAGGVWRLSALKKARASMENREKMLARLCEKLVGQKGSKSVYPRPASQ